MQVVVHEDVREPLLRLAPRSDHLPDVEEGCDPGAIVQDVPRHVHGQPGLRRGVVQEPRKRRAATVAAALHHVGRAGRPRPDAAPPVLRHPHEALLRLVGPLQAGVAASPAPQLAALDRQDPVARLGMVDERRQHRGELALPCALAHDDRVADGVQPVPADEPREPLVAEGGALGERRPLPKGRAVAELRPVSGYHETGHRPPGDQ
mmetsp:Transcript_76799/g.242731  ORF Transcript_76799/g.242731 Transcript_76799/m.242731 type:complete len:206 (-) Transcript_76799:203-820(-)